jgi:catechol O-methyltransferase
MAAMDEFWSTYYRGQNSKEWALRGEAIDDAVKATKPQATLELGTYCGYSAIRIGRLLPAGAQLVSVEIDPLYAAIATKVVEHAGLSDRVKIEIGSLSDRLEAIQSKHNLGALDTLLMDHGASEYLSDLRLLESKGMIKESTSVLCDWTLYPGSDEDPQVPRQHEEFVQYLETSGRSKTSRQTLHNKEVFSVSTWSGFPV